MDVRWKSLKIANKLLVVDSSDEKDYAAFEISPLEKGFGTTLGNSMRRVLLSSLEGVAPVAIKMTGVEYEYSSVDGVYEDVLDIILNVRKLVFKVPQTDECLKASVTVNKEGEVRAKDLELPEGVEIFNPDQIIMTLSKNIEISFEVYFVYGRGYVKEDAHDYDLEDGVVYIDSFFSPVEKVWLEIEDVRVGRSTDFDKLFLYVKTNGSISAYDALLQAAAIWRKYLEVFDEVPVVDVDEEQSATETVEEEDDIVNKPISDLEFTVRSSNCLRNAGIKTLGELAEFSSKELLALPNFGTRSLKEVCAKLEQQGLQLRVEETSE